jgi:hypothetical protein
MKSNLKTLALRQGFAIRTVSCSGAEQELTKGPLFPWKD